MLQDLVWNLIYFKRILRCSVHINHFTLRRKLIMKVKICYWHTTWRDAKILLRFYQRGSEIEHYKIKRKYRMKSRDRTKWWSIQNRRLSSLNDLMSRRHRQYLRSLNCNNHKLSYKMYFLTYIKYKIYRNQSYHTS